VTPETIKTMLKAAAARQPVALAVRLSDAASYILPDPAAPADLNTAGSAALAAERNSTHMIGGEDWFIEARNPALRLIIVGAVHIAQALCPLAALIGLEVTLVDPRSGYATPARFPDAVIKHDWPDAALDALRPERRTAVVMLTHDRKLDDPALDRALRSEAFYIGALGSRKSQAARLERLRALGHDEATLRRVRGPVGLDIGALGAAEIAVSIIAEITAARRGVALGTRAMPA
jgi:xanthine dehydrogenase accessory factor